MGHEIRTDTGDFICLGVNVTWNGPGFLLRATRLTRSFKSKLIRARPLQASVISGGDMAAPTRDNSPKNSARTPRGALPGLLDRFSHMVVRNGMLIITKQGADEGTQTALRNE